MKAPLVPDPSSLETTLILPVGADELELSELLLELLPQAVNSVAAITHTTPTAINFLTLPFKLILSILNFSFQILYSLLS